eukprot:jgi/Psemu1/22827/gm1.22827_g
MSQTLIPISVDFRWYDLSSSLIVLVSRKVSKKEDDSVEFDEGTRYQLGVSEEGVSNDSVEFEHGRPELLGPCEGVFDTSGEFDEGRGDPLGPSGGALSGIMIL